VRGQTVHYQGLGVARARQQPGVELVGRKDGQPLIPLGLLAHTGPHIRIKNVHTPHPLQIIGDADLCTAVLHHRRVGHIANR